MDYSQLSAAQIVEIGRQQYLEFVRDNPFVPSPKGFKEPDPEQYMGKQPELHRGLPVPPLNYITAWMLTERQVIAIYQRDRKALAKIGNSSIERTRLAVERVKEFEFLIKKYYADSIQ